MRIKATDQMCGQLGDHSIPMARSDRDCNCKPVHNENCMKKCKFVARKEIETLFLKNNKYDILRKKYSQK